MTRRTIMAAALVVPLRALQTGSPKIGLIGLGNRSRAHLESWKTMPGVEIVALCDLESAKIAKVNQSLGGKAAAYTDYRELLKDPNVQAVTIVAPNFLHYEMTMAALRAGKDVLVEKPVALNYKQAKEMLAEARCTGRTVAVGMQRRYAQPDHRIGEIVTSGRIGAVQWAAYAEFRGDWNPNSWKYTDQNGKAANWRLLKKTAGSTELEMNIHSYAFLYSLIQSPLKRMTASGGNLHFKDRETRDASGLLAEFENGARVQHSLCLYAPGVTRTCTIIGERGSIEIEKSTLVIRAGAKVDTEEIPAAAGPAEVAMYREFFSAIAERRAPVLSIETAIEASKLAWGAEISIAEGRAVTASDFS